MLRDSEAASKCCNLATIPARAKSRGLYVDGAGLRAAAASSDYALWTLEAIWLGGEPDAGEVCGYGVSGWRKGL